MQAVEDEASWIHSSNGRATAFPELRTLTLFYPHNPRDLYLDPPDPPIPPEPEVTARVHAEYEHMREHLFRRNSCMRREVDYMTDTKWTRADRFLHAQAFLCAYFLGELKYARADDLKPPPRVVVKQEAAVARAERKKADDDACLDSDESSSEAESFNAEEMDAMLRNMLDLLSSGRVRLEVDHECTE